MKLIVGLGNPGAKYSSTRHNIGFMVIDNLASRHGIEVGTGKGGSLIGRGRLAGEPVVLAKPQTFMNRSGEAVRPNLLYMGIGVDDLIIIHDDIDLEFGRIKVKKGGGHGGHNGLKSVISHLGDSGFTRIRVGIGRPGNDMDVSSYVLSPFAAKEREQLREIIDNATDAVEAVVLEGPVSAMNRFN